MKYLFIFLLAMGACTPKADLHVTSNTSWSGSLDGVSYDGHGNATFHLEGSGIICWVFQKNTESGRLSTDVDGGQTKTTTAEYGIVSDCWESY